MSLKDRIELLVALGEHLAQGDAALDAVIQRAYIHNPWFTPANTRRALKGIREAFLRREALEGWIQHYILRETAHRRTVGLVLAGNIPLVGFHDVLAVWMTGHRSQIKLSDKDRFLIPYLLDWMTAREAAAAEDFELVEKLEGYDAVIATGSNNSARYFEAYFGRKPHIIRRNRNGVAVLTGRETAADLAGIADDALAYFGLGCRNVSKLYVPEGYRFEPLLEALHEHRELVLHNKYKNNFDYNYTLLILNRVEHLANGCVLLIEDRALPSRIASLHYEYYADDDQLRRELGERTADIQCVVSVEALEGWNRIAPGQAQQPGLRDYADGVDTVQFLLGLN